MSCLQKTQCLGVLLLAFLCLPMANLCAAYTVPDSYLHPKLTVEIGSARYPVGHTDDSPVFQQAIDDVHTAGGGHVVVPAGEYRVMNLQLKSEVHIRFNKDVILRPCLSSGKHKKEVNLFDLGGDGPIKNASLTGPEARTVFDFTKMTADLRAVTVGQCDNFRVANLTINDHQTKFSSIELGWLGVQNGVAISPKHGLIENITANDADYGYGAIQAQAGESITFRNIKSVGGVAVRLETGLAPMNRAQIGGLFNILVENAVSINGQAALMISPHTMREGDVVARDISADGSEFAVLIEKGFVSKKPDKGESGLAPGSFNSITIDGVKAVYWDDPIVTRFVHLRYYPKELHHLITLGSGKQQPDLGPSIAAVANMAEPPTKVSITHVTAIGFKYRPEIMTSADLYQGSLADLHGQGAKSSPDK